MLRPCACLLLVTAAAAADATREFRLGFGLMDVTSYEAEYDYRAGANSFFATQTLKSNDYTGDNPKQLEFTYLHAQPINDRADWVLAFGGYYEWSSDEIDGETYDQTELGGVLKFGARLGKDRLSVEALPLLRLGSLKYDDADVTAGGQDDEAEAAGSDVALGLEVGLRFLADEHIAIGLSTGIERRWADTETKFGVTGGRVEAEFNYTVIYGRLFAAYVL